MKFLNIIVQPLFFITAWFIYVCYGLYIITIGAIIEAVCAVKGEV